MYAQHTSDYSNESFFKERITGRKKAKERKKEKIKGKKERKKEL